MAHPTIDDATTTQLVTLLGRVAAVAQEPYEQAGLGAWLDRLDRGIGPADLRPLVAQLQWFAYDARLNDQTRQQLRACAATLTAAIDPDPDADANPDADADAK